MSNVDYERGEYPDRLRVTGQILQDLHSCWFPHEGQVQVGKPLFYGGAKRVFVECGRKFGKTDDSIYTLNRFAAMTPNSHYYYIAPTSKQGGELVWENGRLPNFFKGALKDKYVQRVYEQDMRVVFKNGSFIKVDGAENYEAYRGINPHGIVYDEFKDHDERFHEAMEPNLAPYDAWLLILGTPPETEDNLFCRLAEEFKYDADSRYFNMPTHTNPHISKEWLEKQRQRLILRGDEHVWLREYMAKRVKSGQKYIFPMLKTPEKNAIDGSLVGYTEHVRPHQEIVSTIRRYYRDYDYYITFDPGSASCFAVLLSAVHRQSKKVLILGEIYEKDKNKTSTKQIYPRAKRLAEDFNIDWHRITKTYDNAATWFANEVLYEFGDSLMPCSKDVKNKENKLSVIKDFLLDGLWQASENCVKLLWEMENYKTDDKNNIPKENDHLIDDMRYFFSAANLHSVPKKRIIKDPDRRIEWEDDDDEFEEDKPLDIYPELEGDYDYE